MASATTLIGTNYGMWNKEALPAGSTPSTFSIDWIDTLTSPATDAANGVYRATPVPDDTNQWNQVAAFFYTNGDENTTFSARVWGVSQVSGTSNHTGTLLAELTLTIGAATGVNMGTFGTGVKFVDTISVDTDASNQPPGIRVVGDTPNRIAMLLLDAMGFRTIIIEVAGLGGSKKIAVVWRVL